jgi:hypothetical protein
MRYITQMFCGERGALGDRQIERVSNLMTLGPALSEPPYP